MPLYPAAARLLLARGADVNVVDHDGNTLLIVALRHYPVDVTPVVEVLLNAGADAKAKGDEGVAPLHCVRTRAAAELLLLRGADVNARNRWSDTPLHHAAGAGNLDVAKFLVDHGADLNAKDDSGCTPLDWATRQKRMPKDAEKWRAQVAEYLHAQGAVNGVCKLSPVGL